MTTVEEIGRLELTPVTETETANLQGFYVRAFKRHTPRKRTGFLVSGIRVILVEQPRPKRIRTRISWSGDNNTFEVEEHVSMAMRRSSSISVFMVKFGDTDAEIIRGKPIITASGSNGQSVFKGKSVEMSWGKPTSVDKDLQDVLPSDYVVILKPTQSRTFSCRLRTKQRSIEINLED